MVTYALNSKPASSDFQIAICLSLVSSPEWFGTLQQQFFAAKNTSRDFGIMSFLEFHDLCFHVGVPGDCIYFVLRLYV
jgi:hypothetical protein